MSNPAASRTPIGSFIGGSRLTGGGRPEQPVRNPATGEVIALLTLSLPADLEQAAENASRGFIAWSSLSAFRRGEVLFSVAQSMRNQQEHLASLLTAEQGKTLKEARAEVAGAADLFDWLGEEGKRVYGRIVPARVQATQQSVHLEPIGPVAAFSPWNYPLALAARKVAHALAAGCSVVIKPAEEAPSAVLAFAQICVDSGVPADAIQVVFGAPAEVSRQLITSPHIRKISFTGSVAVGRQLAALAGQFLKKVTFELGGHSAVIVLDDVDIDRVAELSVASKFRNAGQICISPSRFIVHEAVHDRFVHAFTTRARALRTGDGSLEATDMGPLAHERRVSSMQSLAQDAAAAGARLQAGMLERKQAPGFFWEPTVLTEVPEHARLMREEIFGPIVPVVRAGSLQQAIDLANQVKFGLAGYAFTQSLRSARLLREQMKVGMLGVNTYAVTAPEMPFTGVKDSGLGVAMGTEGLLDHMNIKSLYLAD